MEGRQSRGNLLTVIATTGILVILDIFLAIYHLTHQGPGSGKTEIIIAPILVLLVSVALVSRAGENPSTRWRIIRRIIIGLIFMAALIYIFLGVYHCTHEGWRSGIMEFLIAILLFFLAYALDGTGWNQLRNSQHSQDYPAQSG